MSGHKAIYTDFCKDSYVPLHLQPWWLDAVCGPEHWDLALATDGAGRINGVLPWYLRRRWGLPTIDQPPFTAYAGPWPHYPHNKTFKTPGRYAFEKKTLTELIAQLPKLWLFRQNFRPEIDNWLPFYWQGFRQTTRYTYWFEAPFSMESLENGMKNTLRTDLKKAAELVTISQSDAELPAAFACYEQAVSRRRQKPDGPYALFERLHSALRARGQSILYTARDKETNALHAAIYIAFDQKCVSLLWTATDPSHKSSNAVFLLIREALQFCARQNLHFDFEGSMDPKMEHAFRAFGAELRPVLQVKRWGGTRA